MESSHWVRPAAWLVCVAFVAVVASRFAKSRMGQAVARSIGSLFVQAIIALVLLAILAAGVRSYFRHDSLALIGERGTISIVSTCGGLYVLRRGDIWPFDSRPAVITTHLRLAAYPETDVRRWQGIDWYHYTFRGDTVHAVVIAYWLPGLFLAVLMLWANRVKRRRQLVRGSEGDALNS